MAATLGCDEIPTPSFRRKPESILTLLLMLLHEVSSNSKIKMDSGFRRNDGDMGLSPE